MISKSEVSELFIVLFGRPTEGEGNTYWVNESSANGWGMIETSNAILNLDITKSFLGETLNNNESFVKHLFKNAVNLTEFVSDEQKAGLKYWVDLLDNGTVSKADLVGHFVNAAKDPSNAGANQDLFNNKVIVSNYVADTIAKLPLDGLTPDQQNALIQKTVDIINNVTSNSSSVESAKGEVDGLKESIDEAGLNKIALTTENDTITGTEGGDLISGVVGTAAESTLNPGDKIDGGAGNDVLKVDLKNNFKGLKDDGYIKNIEKLSLTNSSVSNRTFDAKGIDGLQTVALSGEKGISVTNLANIVDVELTNLKADKFNVDSIYADKVLDGSADVQNLKVNGVGAKGASVAITADKIETLNLNTTGSQSFVSADVASISVKGNANLSLATGAKTTTLDASSFGGALDADLSTSASVTSIKGGNGNDKITIKDVAVNVAIDGGAGNDELVIKGSTADTLQPTLTNIEKVTVDGNTKDLTLSLKKAQSVTELSFKNIAKTVTESNGNVETVNILANNATDKAVTINDESLKTINFSDVDDKGASVAAKGKIVADKATELTINSNKVTAAADAVVQAANATKIDINAAKDTVGLTLGGVAKLTDLTVNNKGAFALTGANATDLDSVKNLSVNTEGAFSIATATSLKNLNNLSLNGVSADLNSVNVGTATLASLEANINVSGEFKLGTTTAKGDVDFNIENVGALTLGAITSSTGNASVIISSATGNVTLGAVSATQGNLTLNAGNTLGNITIGALAGDIVSVDLGGVLGTINSASGNKVEITSNEVTYVGSEISKNVVEITAAAGGTDLNAQVIGGAAADDALTIIGKGDTQTITASGDLSGGTLTLTLTDATKLSSLDISGVKGLSAATAIDLKNVSVENKLIVDIQGSDAAETITANSTSATLTAITLSGDLGGGANTVTVAPDAAAVAITTIDLSGLSATGGTLSGTITHNAAQTALTTIKGSAGNDTITIGKVNDGLTVTGGAGNDVFNVTAAKIVTADTPEHATITDFSAGDSIKFAASVTAYGNVGTVAGDTLKAAIKAAIALTDKAPGITSADKETTVYGFTYNGDNYLFYNNANGSDSTTVDDVLVKLTGTTVDLDSISLDGATGVTIA
ncbi:surface array protein [Campylobacter fetus subsp. fetus]|nr:cell surface protein [Campylobacter fetus]QYA61119.1 surface array protein [Campylobacter fetus subsp. fetus]QYA64595.1 surface array protein [Campylobacter fetus subsp. fetus]SQH29813.1 surface array protein [Campylobacter fetus subsp. fetus]